VNVDHYYLPRDQQEQLVAILNPPSDAPPHILAASIPSLVEELAITITGQDRITANGAKVTGGSDEQPLPINLAAVEASDQLHAELNRWAHLVITQRHIDYTGRDNITELARWLARWIIALALCEGAEHAFTSIRKAVQQARRAIDRPRDPRWMHADRIAASDTKLNARGIEALSREMGGDYTGLNRDRVRTLHSAGKIHPVDTDQGSDEQYLFRVGDVLAAHLDYPTRKSNKRSAA